MKHYLKKIFVVFLLVLLVKISFLYSKQKTGSNNATSPELRKKSWVYHKKMKADSPFKELKWRTLGPAFSGGRIETIACPPGNTSTIYAGAGSGNLWKSTNNGTTWKPIFENESAFSIGCVAIAPSAPNIIWVGTGEVLMARSSFAGTGIFKSFDGGTTWENMGLSDSFHIARVLIDPKDPDIVYAAVIGHNYTFNCERGLFKTINGGKTWEKILYISSSVGCIEVIMEPGNNQVLYAVMWERDRKAWNNVVTGPNSGIYKSNDGGEEWIRLKNGLPVGKHIGRIGLAIAPGNPDVIYALVDNHALRSDKKRRIGGELYRSQDRGKSWKKTHKEHLRTAIGYDFCLLKVSPDNENQIFVLGNYLLQSQDGGKTFSRNKGKIINLKPHEARILHLDHHDLWIDPLNPDRLILGNDGGVYMSYDRGLTWLRLNNIPISEVYAVTIDKNDPYNIYIGTQDTAALYSPGNYTLCDEKPESWKFVYLDPWGGGDSYFTWKDPENPSVIYYEHQFGVLRKINIKTKKAIGIMPELKNKLRRNWMTPFLISRYNPKILYYGANKMFKSLNKGDSWECISPDLTTKPGLNKQGNVPFGTITSISESPRKKGLLYIGTDDGNIQMTDNDGKNWTKINRYLPDKWVSRVIASLYDQGTLYVSFTGYREDDFLPYLFRSKNNGKSWRSLSVGLPTEPINVIREDHRDRDILYIGTDLGVYISLDQGNKWYSLCNNLPTTPVHDLMIHPDKNDLVIGTHGRGVFVLDINKIPELKKLL